MLKNKILFIFERYKYNYNKILILKNLSFLLIISFIIIIRSLKVIVKNKLNENNLNMNFSKDNKKGQHQFLKRLKK